MKHEKNINSLWLDWKRISTPFLNNVSLKSCIKMSEKLNGITNDIRHLLQQDYRGVNIGIYALASAGLAASIYRIRPVSKFSKASKVPAHFIRNHELLKGKYAGIQHDPVRVLVDHRAPIYLPFWHSSKPPLPVKLWGVELVSGNAVSWLDCVAKGHKMTLKPIAVEKDDLVSAVFLHLPQLKGNKIETIDIAQKLVELGFAQASVPKTIMKNTLEFEIAPQIMSAEAKAKAFRNGIWSDRLGPVPVYVTLWKKGTQLAGELLLLSLYKFLGVLSFASKTAYLRAKQLIVLKYKTRPKVPKIQAT